MHFLNFSYSQLFDFWFLSVLVKNKKDRSYFRIFVPTMFSGNKMKSIFSGMEARYKCCQSIHKAFVSSSKLLNDPALAGLAAKVRIFFFFFFGVGGGGGGGWFLE